jgi:hypothetical protein
MKMQFEQPNTSLHWQVLAELIRRNQNLRDDVTLIARASGYEFIDANGNVLSK